VAVSCAWTDTADAIAAAAAAEAEAANTVHGD